MEKLSALLGIVEDKFREAVEEEAKDLTWDSFFVEEGDKPKTYQYIKEKHGAVVPWLLLEMLAQAFDAGDIKPLDCTIIDTTMDADDDAALEAIYPEKTTVKAILQDDSIDGYEIVFTFGRFNFNLGIERPS